MYTCDVKVEGDWEGLAKRFSPGYVADALNVLERKFLKTLASEYLARLREAMETGKAEGPALSAAWAAVKGHGMPWYHYGDMARALEVTRLPDKTVHVGVSMQAKNREGKPLHLIAAVLELGSFSTPARPVFDATAEDFSKTAGELLDVKAEVAKAFDL